jgi:kynurenine formamidase
MLLDLTKRLDAALEIYEELNYRDPEFSCKEWCSVETQGYRVSALTLGTQTGTHIDAPAHFDAAGECLDVLPIDELVGRYFLVDLNECADEEAVFTLSSTYEAEPILFVRGASLSRPALDCLLGLAARVWVVESEVRVSGAPPLEFHRLLAARRKYLIENLDAEMARQVKPGGELMALPLRLAGTSGAPCRVVVRNRS